MEKGNLTMDEKTREEKRKEKIGKDFRDIILDLEERIEKLEKNIKKESL